MPVWAIVIGLIAYIGLVLLIGAFIAFGGRHDYDDQFELELYELLNRGR